VNTDFEKTPKPFLDWGDLPNEDPQYNPMPMHQEPLLMQPHQEPQLGPQLVKEEEYNP
jgi:hypothetical protein